MQINKAGESKHVTIENIQDIKARMNNIGMMNETQSESNATH